MKRLFLTLAVVASVFAIGCNSNNSPATPGPAQKATAPQPQTGPAWTLTLHSSCSATVLDQECVAKYGFTLAADGSFTVGPAPAGNKLTGRISDAEFAELNTAFSAAAALSALSATGAESPLDMDYSIDGTNAVTIQHLDKSAELSHATGAQFFYEGANGDAAWALYQKVMTLANEYYSTPFPDSCSEAASAFAATYASVQGCHADSECSYVNGNYDIVPPGAGEYIFTDNCSVLMPLTVANTKIVLASHDSLLKQNSDVANACTSDPAREGNMLRSNCTGRTGFDTSALGPVCGTDHMCHVNSGI